MGPVALGTSWLPVAQSVPIRLLGTVEWTVTEGMRGRVFPDAGVAPPRILPDRDRPYRISVKALLQANIA